MSLWEACSWTLLRSAVLVALALPVCFPLCRLLSRTAGGQRRLVWTLLLVPLFAPHLVTGYGYSNFSLSMIHHPVWNEVLYDLLVLFSVVPVGVVLLYFAPPPPLSGEALHCSRLVTRRNAAKRRGGIGGSSASSAVRSQVVRLLGDGAPIFQPVPRSLCGMPSPVDTTLRPEGAATYQPRAERRGETQAPPWVGKHGFSALKGRIGSRVGSCVALSGLKAFLRTFPRARSTTDVVPLCPGLICLGPSGRVNRDRIEVSLPCKSC